MIRSIAAHAGLALELATMRRGTRLFVGWRIAPSSPKPAPAGHRPAVYPRVDTAGRRRTSHPYRGCRHPATTGRRSRRDYPRSSPSTHHQLRPVGCWTRHHRAEPGRPGRPQHSSSTAEPKRARPRSGTDHARRAWSDSVVVVDLALRKPGSDPGRSVGRRVRCAARQATPAAECEKTPRAHLRSRPALGALAGRPGLSRGGRCAQRPSVRLRHAGGSTGASGPSRRCTAAVQPRRLF